MTDAVSISERELEVGDRVFREAFLRSAARYGRVVEVYPSTKSCLGAYIQLYAVEWEDSSSIERGYMSIDLKRTLEPTTRLLGI